MIQGIQTSPGHGPDAGDFESGWDSDPDPTSLLYKSADAAAIAWANYYNGKPIKDDKEYGSKIYSKNVGDTYWYGFTDPIKSKKDIYKIPIDDISKISVPQGAEEEAFIHSHGKIDNRHLLKKLSTDDRDLFGKLHLHLYLATPYGTLTRANYLTQGIGTEEFPIANGINMGSLIINSPGMWNFLQEFYRSQEYGFKRILN